MFDVSLVLSWENLLGLKTVLASMTVKLGVMWRLFRIFIVEKSDFYIVRTCPIVSAASFWAEVVTWA